MIKGGRDQIAMVAGAEQRRPVSVKLETVNAHPGRVYPPEGFEGWQERLRSALGTCSDDFVNAALIQLQAAARLPLSGIS